MITLTKICKTYGATRALRGIDLHLRPGEVHALLGENGSGKSTTVRVLSGVTRPDGGTISIDGELVEFRSPHAAIECGITTVHQDVSLVPDLSVGENIFLGGESAWRGLRPRRDRQQAAGLLEMLGVDIDPDLRVSDLTLGQRQMVALARAVRQEARLLILDEPTASLPSHESEALFELVRRVREDGMAVLYISHRLPEVLRLADVVTVLKDGVSVLESSPIREHTSDSLIRTMVGRELDALFPQRLSTSDSRVVACEFEKLASRGQELIDAAGQLYCGEIVGLAGLDGSGRAELARILGGAAKQKAGEIIRGQRAPLYVPGDRKRESVIPAFTVAETISQSSLRTFSRWGWVRKGKERAAAGRLATELRIKAAHLDAPISSLSGGNQQKAVLARALVSESELIVCEEPTAGVDVGSRAEIYALLDDLRASGRTVVVSSTDLLELQGLADRVLVIRSGAVAAELAGAALTEHRLLAEQMPLD